MALLYGLHDREAALEVPNGGWCVDTIALSEKPTPVDYDPSINWIVRANWGYGSTGTIPLPDRFQEYADAVASYMARSKGANIVIIGNEIQHEQERPSGVFITPAQYVRCFVMCRDAIKRASPSVHVIPSPMAPYHADPMNWLDYWREMLTLIAASGGCDGLAIHAYTRSSNPADIASEAKMGPPLQGQYSGFYTYRDALFAVPDSLEHLPVYITEFNELLPEGWHDANTGVVREAYDEIKDWNSNPHNQQIRCLVLYRWPKFDKWHIQGKQGVIDDFRAAVARLHKSPETKRTVAPVPQEQIFMPTIHNGSPAAPGRSVFELPAELKNRGVSIQRPQLPAGSKLWDVTSAQWFADAKSVGPDHHILLDARNAAGNRVVGLPFLITWGGGGANERAIVTSEAKPGERWSANYPMTPGDFTVEVIDDNHTVRVTGIHMGKDEPGGFNPGAHTSTEVILSLSETYSETAQPTQPAPAPTVPGVSPVPTLVHPVGTWYPVTQFWGGNPTYYSKFKYDGVPLRGHNGLDFGVSEGTQVCAVDAGTVIKVENEEGGFGLHILIAHAWGESLYAHMKRINVAKGATVQAGQPIGESGNTGATSGPHLHFGLRRKGYSRKDGWGGFSDPWPYLRAHYDASPTPTPTPAQPVGSQVIDPLVLEAILAVESQGDGFENGRLKIRLEAHLLLGPTWGNPSAFAPYFSYDQGNRLRAFYRRSSNDGWTEYHGSQSGEWAAFEVARGIDEAAALRCTSMGAGQVMGFNAGRVGYPDASAMFTAMNRRESAQLMAVVNYCLSDPELIAAMRRRDWAEIVRRYNGVGMEGIYVPRLIAAYEAMSD